MFIGLSVCLSVRLSPQPHGICTAANARLLSGRRQLCLRCFVPYEKLTIPMTCLQLGLTHGTYKCTTLILLLLGTNGYIQVDSPVLFYLKL